MTLSDLLDRSMGWACFGALMGCGYFWLMLVANGLGAWAIAPVPVAPSLVGQAPSPVPGLGHTATINYRMGDN